MMSAALFQRAYDESGFPAPPSTPGCDAVPTWLLYSGCSRPSGKIHAAQCSPAMRSLPLLLTHVPCLRTAALSHGCCRTCAGDVARVVHSRQCVNGDGQEVPCCAWAPDAWVAPYMSLASVMLLWTVFLFGQFRIFTISGTVAQWSAPLLILFL